MDAVDFGLDPVHARNDALWESLDMPRSAKTISAESGSRTLVSKEDFPAQVTRRMRKIGIRSFDAAGNRIGSSGSNLSKLVREPNDTPTLHDFCRLLRVDVDAFLESRIDPLPDEDTKAPSPFDRLLGTDQEETGRAILETLAKIAKPLHR